MDYHVRLLVINLFRKKFKIPIDSLIGLRICLKISVLRSITGTALWLTPCFQPWLPCSLAACPRSSHLTSPWLIRTLVKVEWVSFYKPLKTALFDIPKVKEKLVGQRMKSGGSELPAEGPDGVKSCCRGFDAWEVRSGMAVILTVNFHP